MSGTDRPLSRLYCGTQRRLIDLVVAAGDSVAATTSVPACPDWTVREVLAHVTGVAADVLRGRIEGVATEPWTAAQVATRRDEPVGRIVDEWTDVGPKFAAMLDDLPGWYGSQAIADLTVHEHDVRGALGQPGARDSQALHVGLDMLLCSTVHPPASAAGLGPLLIRAGESRWLVGGDSSLGADAGTAVESTLLSGARPALSAEPADATLDADSFELFRAVSGRRSEAQIRALAWSVDPAPYLPLFTRGPFAVRTDDLIE